MRPSGRRREYDPVTHGAEAAVKTTPLETSKSISTQVTYHDMVHVPISAGYIENVSKITETPQWDSPHKDVHMLPGANLDTNLSDSAEFSLT